ncbi:MAG: hypothetical protein R2758_05140 [Bacteroidales bacterium]
MWSLALSISRERKSLGYAVTEVSGSDVARVRDLNLVNSLAGRVSGVVVTQGTFGPGSSSRVIIREITLTYRITSLSMLWTVSQSIIRLWFSQLCQCR